MVALNYIGTMNGWKSEPVEFTNHRNHCKKDRMARRKIANCYYEYTCHECGIVWKDDSSG